MGTLHLQCTLVKRSLHHYGNVMPPDKAPRTQRSVWERLPTRADQPSLSRAQIVQTAIAIADVEGAQGITMRRIATALGAGAMSLYRHVFSKDDLLDS